MNLRKNQLGKPNAYSQQLARQGNDCSTPLGYVYLARW